MENLLNNPGLTNSTDKLAELNKFNKNYFAYAGTSGIFNLKAIAEDFELLKEYSCAYQKKFIFNEPIIGDCLQLPDGQIVYFCHIHTDSIQTCPGGSFHLSPSGFLSFSGGLDSGISISDIELSNEKSALPIWFCHRGFLTAGSAIYARIECRVWKTKSGADLSGIPQVERLRKKILKEKSETITKIDGNGREYTEYLPTIIIKKTGVSEDLLKEIAYKTELTFEDDYFFVPVYWSQPMKLEQIERLKAFDQFKLSESQYSFDGEQVLIFTLIDQK